MAKKSKKVGKWGSYSFDPTGISPSGLQDAINEILQGYGDVVYQATETGLDAAEKVLVNELKSASPKRTGKFAKAWKGTGRKYKLERYVGNSATVEGKGGEPISLTNILEYSTTRGHPFVADTYENCVDKLAAAVVDEIKKGV